jgi:hypothetical protein
MRSIARLVTTEPDDTSRYIEYLQERLLIPGWAGFDSKAIAEWYANNGFRESRLGKTLTANGQEDHVLHLELLAREFEPSTRFEHFKTPAIFGPLLERVKEAAQATGLKSVRGIRIATSTEIGATALARPTSGEHILFVGPGTWAFCNYWAKAVTALIKTIAQVEPNQPVRNSGDVIASLKTDPSGVVLAGRLALYYGTFGTVLGFGEVEQPQDYRDYRVSLLNAIETFVVAHEYSHFVAHERIPDLDGQELEIFCDEMGLQLSRNCTYSGDGWLGFTGVGAVVFLRSVELCAKVRHLLHESSMARVDGCTEGEHSNSHPPTNDRVSAIKCNAIRLTAEDQRESVQRFLEEYDRILSGMSEVVVEASFAAIRGENKRYWAI